MHDREIQNAAQLTVRESQLALFVNEGRIGDLFTPGRYTLNIRTLQLLTKLQNWDKLFAAPFKSDLYFQQPAHALEGFNNLTKSLRSNLYFIVPEAALQTRYRATARKFAAGHCRSH